MANSEETLAELIGCEIINAGFTDDGFSNIPVLVVRGATHRVSTLLVMADAEGNGKGWIHIYELAMDEDPPIANPSKSSLSDLKGSKVVDAGLRDEDDLTDIPTIAVETSTGEIKILMVMSDPEGNGAGWLDVRRIHLAQDAIHPDRNSVAALSSEDYQYVDVSQIKNASQLRKFLQPGMVLEQTRFHPKSEFNHLCIQKVTAKEISFNKLGFDQQGVISFSPASKWLFDSEGISVWNSMAHLSVQCYALKIVERSDLDDADWSVLLDQVRKKKTICWRMYHQISPATTNKENMTLNLYQSVPGICERFQMPYGGRALTTI